jgi:hypothetical protein
VSDPSSRRHHAIGQSGPSLFRVGNRRYRPAGIPAQG